MAGMNILVTGAAGFIGFHLSRALLGQGVAVTGLDNLNDYYDVQLKKDRLALLEDHDRFRFIHGDICDRELLERCFAGERFDRVIHLAAQAGVRHSLKNPYVYVESNLVGFTNILEECRKAGTEHLIFASSSSVYGANRAMPFSVHHNVDHPISLYAATKKANELMAHAYAHLFKIPCTGLRFFTVYGPWGRPDMAYFLFTRSIFEGRTIQVFNQGRMKRDFTYVDDVIEGILRLIDHIPRGDAGWSGTAPDPASSFAPYRIYNIGNNQPVELMRFISVIENAVGKEAKKDFLPLQPGDVPETFADVDDLMETVEYRPRTTIEEGLGKFIDWYREYYGKKGDGPHEF
ncbi:MAG: NAD-dependent epimerase [Deltaproteobacteria bacterium]|nr:NAD-dependent epimerase [Deltaproteobacteria bacterium]